MQLRRVEGAYMKLRIALAIAIACLTLAGSNVARAELVAAWAQGHGGMASNSAETDVADSGLGFQLGARLLLLESYLDHTRFGEGASVTRGVLGLRGGLGSRNLRLVLRGGLGVVEERGGALSGRSALVPERQGGVARVGVALETRVAPLLLAGFGIDGERFILRDPATATNIVGSDIFASLKLMFEIGI
jgi:hypothetical protein